MSAIPALSIIGLSRLDEGTDGKRRRTASTTTAASTPSPAAKSA
ncbi:hypothetical protein [Komagataeibacter oboediens]|nr:hypothetical protein [Komagataeibacter oboediens]